MGPSSIPIGAGGATGSPRRSVSVRIVASAAMEGAGVDHATLKARQRVLREEEPLRSNKGLLLRVHRALSWLEAAEANDDLDTRFMCLWVAFNAAYATEIDDSLRLSEQAAFRAFLARLVALDREQRIETLVWNEFSESIRNLLRIHYLFADFWRFHAGRIGEAAWKHAFEQENRRARNALASRRTAALLGIVLSRVYVLRNQLVHGGATWGSQVNREQLRVSVTFLARLVPQVIALMLETGAEAWPPASYPVVDGAKVDKAPRRRRAPR